MAQPCFQCRSCKAAGSSTKQPQWATAATNTSTGCWHSAAAAAAAAGTRGIAARRGRIFADRCAHLHAPVHIVMQGQIRCRAAAVQ